MKVLGPLSIISIDADCMRVYWHGRHVHLTAAEFRVVHTLWSAQGRILSHAILAQLKIDKRNHERPRNVASTIKRIRRAFKAVDPSFDAIATARGYGYCWNHPATLPERSYRHAT